MFASSRNALLVLVLRKFQQAFVDKMLAHSLRYGNVLYCMNNETSTSPALGLPP